MLWFGIGLVITGIIIIIAAGYAEANEGVLIGIVAMILGIMSIGFFVADKNEMDKFDKNYPAEKKYEFYKIYTEDNKEEYVLDPKFVNGTIVVDGKVYTKYSGYKKLTREEAAGHYK